MSELRNTDGMPPKWLALTRPLGALAAAGLTLFAANAAFTQEAVDFPDDLTLIVPYGVGGGSNLHNRLFVEGLRQTLPDQPSIIVRNIEGGGSIMGTNEFFTRADSDGRMFIGIGPSTILNQIFEDPAVNYDLSELIPFLSSPSGFVVYARTDYAGGLGEDPAANVQMLIESPPTIASQTLTSSDLGQLVTYSLLGIEPHVVFGIGLGESRAGFERGEFQMRHDTMLSYSEVEPLIEDGSATLLFTMGYDDNGTMVRDPALPDVPHFLEIYEAIHGEPLSGIEYEVWKTLFDLRVMAGKMLLLPGGTPEDIVQAYTDATQEALDLPVMNTDSAQLILGVYPQVIGPEAAGRVLDSALGLQPEHMDWLRAWADENYGGF